MALSKVFRVPRVLNYLPNARAIVGLAWTSGIIAVLRNTLLGVPEFFPAGEEVGTVLNTLALSYLGAFAFNILVVAMPRQRDIRHSLSVAAPHIRLIVNNFKWMLGDFYTQASEELPQNADNASLNRVLSSLRPFDTSNATTLESLKAPPLLLTNFELIKRVGWATEGTVSQLTPLFGNLDVELATTLYSLPNTLFAELARHIHADTYQLDSLDGFAPSLFDHWLEVDRLSNMFRDALTREGVSGNGSFVGGIVYGVHGSPKPD